LIPSKSLIAGESKSCGCSRKEAFTCRTHGATGKGASTKERTLYNTWRNMKARCFRPWRPQFKHYDRRGIVTSAQWSVSFAFFWCDMEATWTPGLSLERLNNNGPYNKSNCQWATPHDQVRNRRPNGNGKHQIAVDEPF